MTGSRAPRRKPTSVPAARRHPTPVSSPAGRTTFGGQLYVKNLSGLPAELSIKGGSTARAFSMAGSTEKRRPTIPAFSGSRSTSGEPELSLRQPVEPGPGLPHHLGAPGGAVRQAPKVVGHRLPRPTSASERQAAGTTTS